MHQNRAIPLEKLIPPCPSMDTPLKEFNYIYILPDCVVLKQITVMGGLWSEAEPCLAFGFYRYKFGIDMRLLILNQ